MTDLRPITQDPTSALVAELIDEAERCKEALTNFCHLKAEQDSGVMPNHRQSEWRKRWDKAWIEAEDIVRREP